ncbi:MAG: site-specific integrase [Ardenticatenales bacterium]|nr:site-specific integrase [Ardenticatenales bacterium]
MTDELTSLPSATLARWENLAEQANHYADQAQSTNTRRAYDSDFRHFAAWCESHAFSPLPATPAVVAAYVADMAEQQYKVATINRCLTAIRRTHETAGHESPTTDTKVRQVMKGIRRVLSVAQEQKAAATVEVLRAMVDTLAETLIGTRVRALLLVGFAGAFRRSELVGLGRCREKAAHSSRRRRSNQDKILFETQ